MRICLTAHGVLVRRTFAPSTNCDVPTVVRLVESGLVGRNEHFSCTSVRLVYSTVRSCLGKPRCCHRPINRGLFGRTHTGTRGLRPLTRVPKMPSTVSVFRLRRATGSRGIIPRIIGPIRARDGNVIRHVTHGVGEDIQPRRTRATPIQRDFSHGGAIVVPGSK